MRLKIRSILYCFGRSNESYFDPSIKLPAIFRDHFSWIVFLSYWSQWWLMTYWLTIEYFFKYQFKDWLKKTGIELFYIWTTPFWFSFFGISLFWLGCVYLDPIFYRSINTLRWKSDWYIISWGQYYFFYKYFKTVRYFFYFKIYWIDLKYALNFTWWICKMIYEQIFYEEMGPVSMQYRDDLLREEREERKLAKKGLSLPPKNKDHIKSRVVLNKKYYYPSKVNYYLTYRNRFKTLKLNHFKNNSKWN